MIMKLFLKKWNKNELTLFDLKYKYIIIHIIYKNEIIKKKYFNII